MRSKTLLGLPLPAATVGRASDTDNPISDVREVTSFDRRYAAGLVIAQKYRLERCIGHGGMGEVWVAYHQLLDVFVAIKLLRHAEAIPEGRERLLREARLAARVRHPAVLQVFDVGLTEQQDPFMVMELLQGEDLADYLARLSSLPPVVAARIGYDVADGLHAAHRKGVIHRDLKPDNIFLATNEHGGVQTKIVDFGIAKTGLVSLDPKLTGVGVFLGTPAYLAPEQIGENAEGEVDERADIWALCVSLYEMIAGRLPFEGKSIASIWQSVLRDDPPRPAQLDDTFWSLLQAGLQKDRNQRLTHASVLRDALAAWLLRQGVRYDKPLDHYALGNEISPPPSSVTSPRRERVAVALSDSVTPVVPPVRTRAAASTPAAHATLDEEIFASLRKP